MDRLSLIIGYSLFFGVSAIAGASTWLDSSSVGDLWDDRGIYRFDQGYTGTIAGGADLNDLSPSAGAGPADVRSDAVAFFSGAHFPFSVDAAIPALDNDVAYSGSLEVSETVSNNLVGLTLPRVSNTGDTLVLGRAQLIGGFAKVVPTLQIGSIIELPDTDVDGNSLPDGVSPEDYWSPQPFEDRLNDPFTTDIEYVDGNMLPGDFSPRYHYSLHSQELYAASEGTVTVYFRTQSRVAGAGNDKFGVRRFTYQVASASDAARSRNIFWNLNGFDGPLVNVPDGTVTGVDFIYNTTIPERVEEAYVEPGATPPEEGDNQTVEELRTVWYDRLGGYISAYNAEGRILVEFLGAPSGQIDDLRGGGQVNLFQSLGVLVLNVQRGVEPSAIADVYIGDRLLPIAQPFAESLEQFSPLLPISELSNSANPILEGTIGDDNATRYYTAIRTTTTGERASIYWMANAADYNVAANSGSVETTGILWPRYFDQYSVSWPDETTSEGQSLYARYLVPDASDADDIFAQFTPGQIPEILFFGRNDDGSPEIDASNRLDVDLSDDGQARALLRLTSGTGPDWYIRLLLRAPGGIESASGTPGIYDLWNSEAGSSEYDTASLRAVTVEVGDEITAPAGLEAEGVIRQSTSNAPYHLGFYSDPLQDDVSSSPRTSRIVPVNTLENRDILEIWWTTTFSPPSYVADEFTEIRLPVALGRYEVVWPSDAPVAYIGREPVSATSTFAGENGLVVLPEGWETPEIYRDAVVESDGYNPNEEHAFIRNGNLHYLRDDLNVYSETSQPFAIVSYQLADSDLRELAVYKIERGVLEYLAVAGSAVGGINSLQALPLPLVDEVDQLGEPTGNIVSRNREISQPEFPAGVTVFNELRVEDLHYAGFSTKDKVGTTWIVRGPHDDSSDAKLLMEYFYPIQTGFDIPGVDTATLPEDQVLPFVREFIRNGSNQIETAADGTPLFANTYNETTVLVDGVTFSTPVFNGGEIAYADHNPLDANLLDDLPAPVIVRPVWPDYFEQNPTLDPLDYGISPQQLTYGTLRQGETLYSAKNGLPALGSAVSAEIFYDQEYALTYSTAEPSRAVALIDPTAAKRYFLNDSELDELPSVPTTIQQGLHFFYNLPSHLESRFFFDPNQGSQGALVFVGEFVDEIAGEDYIQLNVLSDTDIDTLKAIVPDSDIKKALWDSAIENLSVTVTTRQRDIFEIAQDVVSREGASELKLNEDIRRVVNASASDSTYDFIFGETFGPSDAAIIRNDDQAVDRYSAVGISEDASRWVTVMAGNGVASDPGDPTQFFIFKSSPELFIGDGKIVPTQNPLSEKVAIRLSNDFGGQADIFEIEWARSDPIANGAPSAKPARGESPSSPWFADDQNSGVGEFLINLGGVGVDVIKDKFYVARYRRVGSESLPYDGWSEWSEPLLVEGWIKRVLAGINPFNQRLTDLANNPVNSDVSILTQAGSRWEGDVPLNLDNINDFGLISIYETVLKRGINLSIGAAPPVNDTGANQALLLAANYLGDLYSALGDEAYSDALNPTVSLDAAVIDTTLQVPDPTGMMDAFEATATSRFSFEGQIPNLLGEELALLRGRDDFLATRTDVQPVYNRLYWNFTRGIDLGEVIYALNYNIREGGTGDNADGILDAEDAAHLFPQGHGDAFGHYLTALKNYYRLLSNPNYDWVPAAETINLLGQTVQVDYRDERKFAATAASLAQTSALIANLTHRLHYNDENDKGWSHFDDGAKSPATGVTRDWGVDDWASRGYQSTYYNWLVANTIVPAPEALGLDPDSLTPDVTRVTRADVLELDLLPLYMDDIQRESDLADQHLSPIGLRSDSMAFDLSAQDYRDGETHFEQVYDRAVRAVENATSLFDRAAESTRLLRVQGTQVDNLDKVIADNEVAFEFQLLDLLGAPYPEDIGPGRLYPQGYDGPDYFNYAKIDRLYAADDVSIDTLQTIGLNARVTDYRSHAAQAELVARLYESDTYDAFFTELLARAGENNADLDELGPEREGVVQVDIQTAFGSFASLAQSDLPPLTLDQVNSILLSIGQAPLSEADVAKETVDLVYQYDPRDGVVYAGTNAGRRSSTGLIQIQLRDMVEARAQLEGQIDSFNSSVTAFESLVNLYREEYQALIRVRELTASRDAREEEVLSNLSSLRIETLWLNAVSNTANELADATSEGFPKVVGFSNDATSAARAAVLTFAAAFERANAITQFSNSIAEVEIERSWKEFQISVESAILDSENGQQLREMIYELETLYNKVRDSASDIDAAVTRLAQSRSELTRLLAEKDHLLSERERFRQRVAGVIQGYRIRDNAFRGLRNEALEQYRNLFDLASQYTYLAAKAYDYETGLLGTDSGIGFFNDIVASRALGVNDESGPQFIGNSTGDTGLSGVLAQLNADWQVAESRLGINNPDALGTTFSLRQELLRILPTSDADITWIQFLEANLVDDIRLDPDVAAHSLGLEDSSNLPVPGLVIEFPTSIRAGENFFGLPLAAGDSTFYSGSFATKIHSAGVVFTDYRGVDQTPIGGESPYNSNVLSENGMSSTPFVYLLPTGTDHLEVPFGNTNTLRSFDVHDQVLPLPFNIGNVSGNEPAVTHTLGTLPETIFTPRQHQAFRAVNDPAFFYSPFYEEFTSSRLIGRSAWNTNWKLVIPGRSLLADGEEGLSRFIRSVNDIKIHLRTYSHSGN